MKTTWLERNSIYIFSIVLSLLLLIEPQNNEVALNAFNYSDEIIQEYKDNTTIVFIHLFIINYIFFTGIRLFILFNDIIAYINKKVNS